MTILWHESLDSTQEAVRRSIDSLENLTVIASGYQSAGRGQRGNSWLAAPWENLTFSLLLRFGSGGFAPLEAADQFMISVVSTLAVHDYLAERGIESRIKWPNDIYCGDKKICGMLIENRLGTDGVRDSIVGIGLNVNQVKFPPNVPNPTSMTLRSGKTYDVKAELEVLMALFASTMHLLANPEGFSELRENYLNLMYRRDTHCQYIDCIRGERFFGTIRGISKDYRLLIEDDQGHLRSFAFKEVNYII